MQTKNKAHQMTLYNPLTKAFIPVPLPSQNLCHLKLSGCSYPGLTLKAGTPARDKIPDNDMRARTMSLNAARVFWTLSPHLRHVPWMKHTNVRQQNATSRV